MKAKMNLIFTAILCGLVVVSCKKKEDTVTDPSTINTPAGSTTPTFTDADGVMWAVKSTSTVSGFTFDIGLAVGVFFNGTTDYVNVGAVSANGLGLAAQTNNSYVYTPAQSNPTGIDFSSGVLWDVAGANGHAAFSYDVSSTAFPTGSAITSGSTVTIANGYTLTCSSVNGADSTLFLVGNISKTMAGSATSCTFSAAELSGLVAGSTVVQIAPYSIIDQTINGKKYYFGKEVVNSLQVTVE